MYEIYLKMSMSIIRKKLHPLQQLKQHEKMIFLNVKTLKSMWGNTVFFKILPGCMGAKTCNCHHYQVVLAK